MSETNNTFSSDISSIKSLITIVGTGIAILASLVGVIAFLFSSQNAKIEKIEKQTSEINEKLAKAVAETKQIINLFSELKSLKKIDEEILSNLMNPILSKGFSKAIKTNNSGEAQAYFEAMKTFSDKKYLSIRSLLGEIENIFVERTKLNTKGEILHYPNYIALLDSIRKYDPQPVTRVKAYYLLLVNILLAKIEDPTDLTIDFETAYNQFEKDTEEIGTFVEPQNYISEVLRDIRLIENIPKDTRPNFIKIEKRYRHIVFSR